jgi:hypothetical protein
MNPKKRAHGDAGFSPIAPKRAKAAVVGPAFTQGISGITASSSPNVYTHVSIPLSYGPAARLDTLDLHATFSAKDHNSATDNTAWTQGWMAMGGETSYEKILPASLDVTQATVESRVMRKLARGGAYAPKTMHFPAITTKPNVAKQVKNWGRTAMQSYLEDITGRTSLNVEEIGSGMRATTLASKLRMRTTGTPNEPGFRDKMRKRFPQLLTAETDPVGGAAHYNTEIHQELTATPGNSPTQVKLWRKVEKAHHDINRESRNRFNFKWREIEAGRMSTTQAGTWWANKFGANKQGVGSLAGTGVKKRTLRRAYVGTKLENHGITHFK